MPKMEPVQSAEPIAVIGVGMRLPGGVRTSEDFWQLLMSNKDVRCSAPENRYSVEGFCDPKSLRETISTPYGYFLDDSVKLDALDTTFFTINQRQAQMMDPQQRLLLEVTWECMENAGQVNLRGSNTGVFVGSYSEDWNRLVYQDTQGTNAYRVLGTADFVLSNALSYHFDLRGPSVTLRTACSAASTGLHMACQALYNGDCEAAVVAGSSIILSPSMGQDMSSQGVLAPDGLCKTFDASADGYARAEGINVVMVKLLKDAVRDNDPIRAVIRSTAVNADGGSSNLSVPSPCAQKALIQRAYEVAGIADLSQTAFVECHGTGTRVGDPIEAGAIGETFGEQGVYIGSVKTNIGHTEGGSGITGLIKSVLALEHEVIPPNRNFSTPNPQIPFEKFKLQVPIEPTPWPVGKHHRISINCFGIGGSNSHIVLDSATSFRVGRKATFDVERDSTSSDYVVVSDDENINDGYGSSSSLFLLPVSAASEHALGARARDITTYVQSSSNSLPSIAYTLGSRRTHLSYRAFCVFDGIGELPEFISGKKISKQPPRLGFVFTGQGAQHARMGKELYECLPSFRQDICAMDEALQSLEDPPQWALTDFFEGRLEDALLNQAEYSQPLSAALQIALVRLLEKWGIKPDLTIGHSSGELAAAYASGHLTLAEACICSYLRGVISQSQTRDGSMAVIGLSRTQVVPYLHPGAQVACVNSPKSVTISGDRHVVDEVLWAIKSQQPDVFLRSLQVNKAYHSYHMEELGPLYEAKLRPHLKPRAETETTKLPFYSTVTGRLCSPHSRLDAEYWSRNLSSPVLFQDATQALLRDTCSDIVLVEIGPHPNLKASIRQIAESQVQASLATKLTYLPTLCRDEDACKSMLKVAGNLYKYGCAVDFAQINPTTETLTDLPNYPWDHRSVHWGESRISKAWRMRKHAHHELLGSTEVATGTCPSIWRNFLRLEDVPWAKDHAIGNDVIFPCAGYIAMMGEAIRQVTGSETYTLRNMAMKSAMLLRDSEQVEVVTTMSPSPLSERTNSSWYTFSIASCENGSWVQHCVAEGKPETTRRKRLGPVLTSSLPRAVPDHYLYDRLKGLGLDFGPRFRLLGDISADTGTNLARATIKQASDEDEARYALHPTAIDALLQLSIVSATRGISRHLGEARIPARIGQVHVSPVASQPLTAEAIVRMQEGNKGTTMNGTARVSSHENEAVLELQNVEFAALNLGGPHGSDNIDRLTLGCCEWRPHLDFCDIPKLLKAAGTPLRNPKRSLDQLAALCILECLHIVDTLDLTSPSSSHMVKYISWLRAQQERMVRNEWILAPEASYWVSLDAASRKRLMSSLREEIHSVQLEQASKTCELQLSVTQPEVFKALTLGEIHPLQLFKEDGRLAAWYDLVAQVMDSTNLLAASAHAQPNMRVLEIGAGTGGTTEIILRSLLTPNGTRMYSEYMFTDISSGFFNTAQERLVGWDGIQYKVLDITKCPGSQGFSSGQYDLVLATNVIHATPCLRESLQNVHFLLRPGGRFLLQELVFPSPTTFVPFIAGFFAGWWSGEDDNRKEQPIVSVERWNQELIAAGFNGIEAAVADDEEPAYQVMTQITAIAPLLPSSPPSPGSIVLIHDGNPDTFTSSLAAALEVDGLTVTWHDINKSDSAEALGQDAIAVVDIERPFFERASKTAFENVIQWIAKLKDSGILWLTRAAQVSCTNAAYAQAIGLARTARVELSADIWTVELQNLDSKHVPLVADIARRFIERPRGASRGVDCEFAVHEGNVLVGRYDWSPKSAIGATLGSPEDPKVMQIGQNGLLNTIHWVQEAGPALADDEVEVSLHCSGLNFKDVMIAMGLVPGDGSGGLEASGVVTRAGANVHHIKPGTRVATVYKGLFATKRNLPAAVVFPIPASLSLEEAATLPIVYCTAIHAIIDRGRLQPGQSILIHSACGGVGQAALQICRMMKAETYATVGSEDKIQYLIDEYGLDREHIFHSRDDSFYEDLMQATGGRGVDLVLNSLSGDLLHASWKCVARWGTMVEIGKRDILEHGHLPLDMFSDNRAFCGISLDSMQDRPGLLQSLMERTLQFYVDGHITPVKPIHLFDATDIQDAFRYMQAGKHIGKIIVRMPEALDTLDAAQIRCSPVELSASSTYILAGGFGGLGKVVATWMVERGAKNLVFLSRSAGTKPSDSSFVRELESQGCSVSVVAGSVMILEDVRQAIRAAPSAVAGVIHLSMVLSDMPLGDVRHEDWSFVNGPKVTGTWNLHTALMDCNLDFFILCGSLSAVFGQPGQASYAAANAFLDSFTQYRHSLGLPCSTVDFGVIEGVGKVKENNMTQQFRNAALHMMQEDELVDAIELAIRRSWPPSEPQSGQLTSYSNPSQLSVGMASTRPLNDPSNRHPLRQDIRMGFARQLDQNDGSTRKAESDSLRQFLAGVESEPGLLEGHDALQIITSEISRLLCGFMMMPEADVDPNTSLESLGVDSLVSIEIRNWWKRNLGVDVSVLEITNARTVQQLGALAVASLKTKYGATQDAHNDQEVEMKMASTDLVAKFSAHVDALDENVSFAKTVGSSSPWPDQATVLLTGATGYLGTEILRQLLASKNINTVAVLVRATSVESGMDRVKERAETAGWWKPELQGRIEVWLGDLCAPHVGLVEQQLSRIRGDSSSSSSHPNVDAIIHNGAVVKLDASYASLEAPNVGGTVELLSLALASTRPLRFVYVSGGLRTELEKPFEEIAPALSTHLGYSQTKNMSDRIVHAIASKLPAGQRRLSVVKSGLLLGPAETGYVKQEDLLCHFIGLVGATQSCPLVSRDGWLYVSPVDKAAGVVVRQLGAEDGEDFAPFLNILEGMFMSSLSNILIEELKITTARPSWAEWVSRAMEHISDPVLQHAVAVLEEFKRYEDHMPSERQRPETMDAESHKSLRSSIRYLRRFHGSSQRD